MQVIVHGGAGSVPDDPEPRQAVLESAASAGADRDDPLDAVEAAVRTLERESRFNAGIGGAVQSDGVVRTDAGVMRSDRAVGAVAGMPGVAHAVSAAQVVLEETPHVLVAGEHAVALAAAFGVQCGVDLWTDRTRERWADLDPPADGPAAQLPWLRERFDRRNVAADEYDHDTVGAVARRADRIAVATSTGGRWLALAGRVGDVPQVGSGFYCSPAGGASATGDGEDIARVTLSRRAVGHLEAGLDAAAAAERAIEEFDELTGASAGIIVMDADGTAGSAYNSAGMQTAVATG